MLNIVCIAEQEKNIQPGIGTNSQLSKFTNKTRHIVFIAPVWRAIRMQNELIFSLRTDSSFSLKDVTDETQLKAKILEWLTRTAVKAVSPKERKLHFEGINKLLGTNFTLEEMTDIYTYLGNGIKHDLCVKFVESGYDMTIIQKEG